MSWKTRGLRGSTLEDMINRTNEKYHESRLCLIQKVPTPITPVEFNKETRTISLAYFDKKSTVDYIGVVQGIPVCFDAKECATDSFPLSNVHEHQMDFMSEFESQGGISFIVISYTERNTIYYLRYEKLKEFWDRWLQGGRRSFRYEEIEERYIIVPRPGLLVPYLDMLQKDLDERV